MCISKLNKKIILAMLCVLFYHSQSSGSEDNPPVGGVVMLVGDAYVQRIATSKWIRITESTLFYQGDTVKTEDGKVRIGLDDGTVIALSPSTEYVIEQVQEEKSIMRLLVGKALNFFKKVKQRLKKIEVYTPVSVIGVRGTEFIVETDQEKSTVLVLQGTVEFRSIQEEFSQQVVRVSSNMESSVKKGGPPSEPRSVAIERIKEVQESFLSFNLQETFQEKFYELGKSEGVERDIQGSNILRSRNMIKNQLEKGGEPPVNQQPQPDRSLLQQIQVRMKYR